MRVLIYGIPVTVGAKMVGYGAMVGGGMYGLVGTHARHSRGVVRDVAGKVTLGVGMSVRHNI